MADTFTMDTSGAVPMGRGENMGFAGINLTWDDIGALPYGQLAQGYIEALFASLAAKRRETRHRDFQGLVHKLYAAHGLSDSPRRLHPGTIAERHAIQRLYVIGPNREHTRYVATPRPLAFSDLHPDTLARILQDCASFENIAVGLGLTKLGEREGRHFYAGRNNGTLQGAFAAAFPPLTFRLGDDGLIYFGEEGQ